jgi:general stress protein CsbA
LPRRPALSLFRFFTPSLLHFFTSFTVSLLSLFTVMKILLAILAAIVIVASFYADYKWRQWIAARKRDRQ